ncbi:uncharacterized protein NPIL_617761 [Nephila pilipes]|uniref:SAP domain-containing protein n=1 Tax=Nephila pilipes TaxID=299642 RepID=A0A8X6PG04_NEPPI|nr:uncharacterized protein NPIL_617761 [Nephila pilipes]
MEGSTDELANDLNSFEAQFLSHLTVAQLKIDLRLRKLSTTGNKNDLISRIIENNIKRNEDGTLDELNNLRIQLQTNETFDEAIPDKTELLNEIEKLKEVELLSNRSYTSPPSTSTPAQIDLNITTILTTMMETQKLLLDKHLNTPNVIQITSNNDTANSIQIFKGDAIENALEWIKEVDRISILAHWSDELKLTNAISRLSGCAKNWQLTTGKNYNDWTAWKTALASRFRRRITMQKFLSHQKKALFTIPQPDSISMIIGDITEEKWQIALTTQNAITVEELIDRAIALDAIRSAIQEKKSYQSLKSQMRYFNRHDEQRHKYNPATDDVRNITCWQCGD